MEIEYKLRKFKLWYFSISHAMLLIRSPKNDVWSTNIDICFSSVEYIDCPVDLDSIMVEKPNLSDLNLIEKKLHKKINQSSITVFVSAENRFYVVSEDILISENRNDYLDLPYDFVKLS